MLLLCIHFRIWSRLNFGCFADSIMVCRSSLFFALRWAFGRFENEIGFELILILLGMLLHDLLFNICGMLSWQLSLLDDLPLEAFRILWGVKFIFIDAVGLIHQLLIGRLLFSFATWSTAGLVDLVPDFTRDVLGCNASIMCAFIMWFISNDICSLTLQLKIGVIGQRLHVCCTGMCVFPCGCRSISGYSIVESLILRHLTSLVVIFVSKQLCTCYRVGLVIFFKHFTLMAFTFRDVGSMFWELFWYLLCISAQPVVIFLGYRRWTRWQRWWFWWLWRMSLLCWSWTGMGAFAWW